MAEYTIDKIEYGGNVYKLQDNQSGYITSYTETDPVFSASTAAGITATDISNWNSKTSNTGTVTSINLISGTGITVSNSNTAITTSGSRTITLNTIKTSKSSSGLGGAQVWKSWEDGANITPPSTIGSYTSTFTVQNSTTIANRYYPIEATHDGHLIVNIPWESVPTNISAFTNDSGYITSYTETDPTVPSWAKQSSKPTYTANEVGALPATTAIPTKTSDLTNDSGFITTDEKVKYTDSNKLNSTRPLLFGKNMVPTGGSQTETVYASNRLMWNDSAQALYIHNSSSNKYAIINYNQIFLANDTTDYSGVLSTAALTASRNYTFPDKTGTVALTSDIPSVYSSTNTGGYLTMATLPIYDGTVE